MPGATNKAMDVLPAHAVRWQPHATAACSTAIRPAPPARPRPAGPSCARSSPLDTSNFGIAFNSTSKVSVVKGKTTATFNKHCFSVSRAAQQGLVPRPCAPTAPCCGPQSLSTLVINAREWVDGWGGGDYARMCAACALRPGCMRAACGLHAGGCMRTAACGLHSGCCMRPAACGLHACSFLVTRLLHAGAACVGDSKAGKALAKKAWVSVSGGATTLKASASLAIVKGSTSDALYTVKLPSATKMPWAGDSVEVCLHLPDDAAAPCATLQQFCGGGGCLINTTTGVFTPTSYGPGVCGAGPCAATACCTLSGKIALGGCLPGGWHVSLACMHTRACCPHACAMHAHAPLCVRAAPHAAAPALTRAAGCEAGAGSFDGFACRQCPAGWSQSSTTAGPGLPRCTQQIPISSECLRGWHGCMLAWVAGLWQLCRARPHDRHMQSNCALARPLTPPADCLLGSSCANGGACNTTTGICSCPQGFTGASCAVKAAAGDAAGSGSQQVSMRVTNVPTTTPLADIEAGVRDAVHAALPFIGYPKEKIKVKASWIDGASGRALLEATRGDLAVDVTLEESGSVSGGVIGDTLESASFLQEVAVQMDSGGLAPVGGGGGSSASVCLATDAGSCLQPPATVQETDTGEQSQAHSPLACCLPSRPPWADTMSHWLPGCLPASMLTAAPISTPVPLSLPPPRLQQPRQHGRRQLQVHARLRRRGLQFQAGAAPEAGRPL